MTAANDRLKAALERLRDAVDDGIISGPMRDTNKDYDSGATDVEIAVAKGIDAILAASASTPETADKQVERPDLKQQAREFLYSAAWRACGTSEAGVELLANFLAASLRQAEAPPCAICEQQAFHEVHLCNKHFRLQVLGVNQEPPAQREPASGEAQVAWLIERSGLCLGIRPACGYRFDWVTFTDTDALRFSRKDDAYCFKEAVNWKPFDLRLEGAIVTEHSWG